MVSILCTTRSGSTNLSRYLSDILDLKLEHTLSNINNFKLSSLERGVLYKIVIGKIPQDYTSVFDFAEDVILKSDKVILLDREDRLEQSESLAFRKLKYGDDYSKYHIQEPYTKIETNLVKKYMNQFEYFGKVLNEISKKYNIPIFTYEEIYLDSGVDRLNKYLEINQNKNIERLHISYKRERITNLNKKMI